MTSKDTMTINVAPGIHRRAKAVSSMRGESLGQFSDRVLDHYITREEKRLGLPSPKTHPAAAPADLVGSV